MISVERRARAPRGGRGEPRPADRRGGAGRRASSSCWPTPRRRRSRSTRTTPVGEELRLRYRYLDLRTRARCATTSILRHDVVTDDPRLPRRRGLPRDRDADPDPLDPRGRARLPRAEPARSRGSWYALPQSPQLFKQLLMIGGYERYFQIARCFRDEDFRADRQPEFTQLDMEMSFVEEEDVIDAGRPRCCSDVLALGGIEVELPLERITYDEAMLRYGSDRPDRRLGMEIEDADRGLPRLGVQGLRGRARVGRRRARAARPRGEFPRSRFDALTEQAQSLGAEGPRVGGGRGRTGWRSPIAKFLSEDEIARRDRRARRARGRRDPDRRRHAPRWPPACSARCAWRWPRASPRATTCSGSWTSRCSSGTRTRSAGTRCTTRSRARPATSTATPARWRSRAYDVVLDGWEIGGGSIRINDPEVQQKVFDALGIGPEEAKERFGFLLEALALRRAAARRHRVRHRPHRRAARRRATRSAT